MKFCYSIHGFLVLLFLLIIPVSSAKQKDSCMLDNSVIDPVLAEFEQKNSQCAVIIMNAGSGELIYVYNRIAAFEKRYPPGSIIKPLSALILLNHSKLFEFSENKKISCPGRYYPDQSILFQTSDYSIFNLPKDNDGKHYFRCSLRDGHGVMNLHNALIHSCNTYFISTVSSNPSVFFDLIVNTFSLHENTGALLVKNREKSFLMDTGNATPFQMNASVIGEGQLICLTPLKVAQLYAAVFSCGLTPVPHEKPFFPSANGRRLSVSPESLRIVNSALSGVIKGGTLKGFDIKNGAVELCAGKTGTATHIGKKYRTHGWNVIHFKYNGEGYVLVSFVENGSGAKEAKDLSKTVLQNLND